MNTLRWSILNTSALLGFLVRTSFRHISAGEIMSRRGRRCWNYESRQDVTLFAAATCLSRVSHHIFHGQVLLPRAQQAFAHIARILTVTWYHSNEANSWTLLTLSNYCHLSDKKYTKNNGRYINPFQHIWP